MFGIDAKRAPSATTQISSDPNTTRSAIQPTRVAAGPIHGCGRRRLIRAWSRYCEPRHVGGPTTGTDPRQRGEEAGARALPPLGPSRDYTFSYWGRHPIR